MILAFQESERQAHADPLVLTANTTLTTKQCNDNRLIRLSSAGGIAVTLPAGSAANEGRLVRFVNAGAGACTVVVTAGYGGAGSGSDTITLAQGEMSEVLCENSTWYANHHTAAA